MVLTEGFDDPTLQTVWVRPSGRGPTIQMAGRVLRKCGDMVKQIVQCRETRHPFHTHGVTQDLVPLAVW